MKKSLLAIKLFLCFSVLMAKPFGLGTEIKDSGEIVVFNPNGKCEDRVRFINNTEYTLHVRVNGLHKKFGMVKVCDDFVTANDTKFVSSLYEDKLDKFSYFEVFIEDGKILEYKAETDHDDFYFTVNEVSGEKLESKNGANDADELLKWKQLFDSGVITREEFEAKKNSLLGL